MTMGTQRGKTRGIKKSEKTIEKVESKAPLSERMNTTAERAREGKQLTVLRRIFGKQPLRNVITKTKEFLKNRKTYSINYMLFQHRTVQEKRAFEVNGRNYYPLLNPAQRQAQMKASDLAILYRQEEVYHGSSLYKVCDESNETNREAVARDMSSTGTVLHRWVI